MHSAIDFLDPRHWPQEPAEYVIRLCNRDASLVALVDYEDYAWARQHTWGYCLSKQGDGRSEKFYAKTRIKTGPGCRDREWVYLHKAILQRAKGPPKHPAYSIADHRNGESLDCRRENLRWATPSMNRINLRGAYPRDLVEDSV